jgi:hypothetical protein
VVVQFRSRRTGRAAHRRSPCRARRRHHPGLRLRDARPVHDPHRLARQQEEGARRDHRALDRLYNPAPPAVDLNKGGAEGLVRDCLCADPLQLKAADDTAARSAYKEVAKASSTCGARPA